LGICYVHPSKRVSRRNSFRVEPPPAIALSTRKWPSSMLYTPAVKLGIHWLIPAGILLLSLAGCNAVKPKSTTAAWQAFERLPQGDYLSSTYIEALKRTRSPYQAGKTGQLSLVVVQRQPSKLLLTPILNLHE